MICDLKNERRIVNPGFSTVATYRVATVLFELEFETFLCKNLDPEILPDWNSFIYQQEVGIGSFCSDGIGSSCF